MEKIDIEEYEIIYPEKKTFDDWVSELEISFSNSTQNNIKENDND